MAEEDLLNRLDAYASGPDAICSCAIVQEAAAALRTAFADRRSYYAAGMLDAARTVGTRAHLSEAQDDDKTIAQVLRFCEAAIHARAATISRPEGPDKDEQP